MFGSHGPSAVPPHSCPGSLTVASRARTPSTSPAPTPAETTTNCRRSRIGFFISCLLGGAMDRAAGAQIRGAAADVAVPRVVVVVVGRVALVGQKRRRRDELARLAVSALRHLLGDPPRRKPLPQWGRAQAFDRRDGRAGHLGDA